MTARFFAFFFPLPLFCRLRRWSSDDDDNNNNWVRDKCLPACETEETDSQHRRSAPCTAWQQEENARMVLKVKLILLATDH
jgi:hypothetical protein